MTFGVRYGHGKAEGKKSSKRESLHFELMLKVLNAESIKRKQSTALIFECECITKYHKAKHEEKRAVDVRRIYLRSALRAI